MLDEHSAVRVLNLLIFVKGTLHFCFAVGPTNYVISPAADLSIPLQVYSSIAFFQQFMHYKFLTKSL